MGRAHLSDKCTITTCPRYNNGKRCKGCYNVNGSSKGYIVYEEEFLDEYLVDGLQW
jgi:hypothetical protein